MTDKYTYYYEVEHEFSFRDGEDFWKTDPHLVTLDRDDKSKSTDWLLAIPGNFQRIIHGTHMSIQIPYDSRWTNGSYKEIAILEYFGQDQHDNALYNYISIEKERCNCGC